MAIDAPDEHQEPRHLGDMTLSPKCPTINGTPSHGMHGTRDFRKVCAGSVAELDGWAWATVGTLPSRCVRCKPPDRSHISGPLPRSGPRQGAPSNPMGE